MSTAITALPRIELDAPPCLIGRVAEEFGCLSNMSAHPVELDGRAWPRAEQLFQALRFPDDHPSRAVLLRERNPMRAKMAAKKAIADAIIAPRSDADLDNMRRIIRAKYEQHDEVRVVLASTAGRQILEDCSRRAGESGLFWGARRVVIAPPRGDAARQLDYLRGLASPTSEQSAALARLEAEVERAPGTRWEGHNWLGRLWMDLRDAG